MTDLPTADAFDAYCDESLRILNDIKEQHRMDWQFSDEGPGPKVRNRPTSQGRELGTEMARLYNTGDPEPDLRCLDCAFRLGTDPNGSISTLMDAIKCISEGVPFLCHMEQTPKTCAGYTRFRKAWVQSETQRSNTA